MRKTSLFALVLITAFTVPAFAQAPPSGPPIPVRGTVDTLDGHTLTVKSPDGKSQTITLAPDFIVRAVVAKTLADIKPGDKVGIASIEGPDHVRKAVEIHIFLASMSNVRILESPWDRGPDGLMTNAPVVEVSSAPERRTLKVNVHGKERKIAVPPDTPIVTYGPGDVSLLKPGAAVVVFARKTPDGSLTAAGVTAEKDGVKPPM